MERDSQGRFRSSEPSYEAPVPDLPESWHEMRSRMEEIQEMRKPLDIWKDSIDIKINTGKTPYFFLGNFSDPHIGSEYTNYDYIQKYMDFIRTTGIKVGLYGDLFDGYNPKILPQAMMDTVANPDEQILAMRQFHEEYQDEIAFEAGGNHEEWTRSASGVEPYRWMTRDLKIPLLNNGGVVNLDVNGIKYKGLVYHKIARYNSSINQTHAPKQMLRMAEDADFVVAGDKHMFGMEKAQLRDKKIAVVQLGTTKTEDKFGKRGMSFGAKPQIGFPTLFFSGEHKNIEMIEDIDEAANHIWGLRALHGEQVEQD